MLDHLLGSDLGSEERAFKVDRHHLVVLALGGVEHGGARFDAGIVDHDIEPAEPAYGDVNQLLQVGKLAHVGFQADRLAAELDDLLLERLGRLRMKQVIDDDARALPRQFENDRLTDPAVAAGHDRGLVVERHLASDILADRPTAFHGFGGGGFRSPDEEAIGAACSAS